MGRSVYVPAQAVKVIYFTTPEDDDGFMVDMDIFDWLERIDGIEKAKGWLGREGKIIASHRLFAVVLSEYCDVWALSFVPKEPDDDVWDALVKNPEAYLAAVESKITSLIGYAVDSFPYSRLGKVGTFSNGEAVFQCV